MKAIVLTKQEAQHLKDGLELLKMLVKLRVSEEEVKGTYDHIYADEYVASFDACLTKLKG